LRLELLCLPPARLINRVSTLRGNSAMPVPVAKGDISEAIDAESNFSDVEEGTQFMATPKMAEACPEPMLTESSKAVDTGDKNLKRQNTGVFCISELPQEFQEKMAHYDKDHDGTIDVGEMLEAASDMKHHQRSNKRLWYVVFALALVTIMQAWAGFGMSFWAVNLSKESKTVMSDTGPVATATDGESIMRMAPATVPNLALEHAIVLDMEHLRTIEEITYTIPLGSVMPELDGDSAPAEISEKVMSIVRSKEAVPKVIIETQSNRKLILEPGKATFKINNVSLPMCGKLKCGSFKVNDPALDKGLLDAKLVAMLGEDTMRRLSPRFLSELATCSSVDCCAGEALCSESVPWKGDPNVGLAAHGNKNSKFKKVSGCCNPVNKGGLTTAATKAKCCQGPGKAKWFDSSKRAWAQVPPIPQESAKCGLTCNNGNQQKTCGTSMSMPSGPSMPSRPSAPSMPKMVDDVNWDLCGTKSNRKYCPSKTVSGMHAGGTGCESQGVMCSEDSARAGSCTKCSNEDACGKIAGTNIPRLKHTFSICQKDDCTCVANKADCQSRDTCEWDPFNNKHHDGFYCKPKPSGPVCPPPAQMDSGVPAPSWGDDDWW